MVGGGLGELCDSEFWITALSSPTVDYFNSLRVNKKAAGQVLINVEILVCKGCQLTCNV